MCFMFQNPIIRITSQPNETPLRYKRYRNYVCQQCEERADDKADDKIQCRPKRPKTGGLEKKTAVILTEVDLNALLFTFVQPLLCEKNGIIKTKVRHFILPHFFRFFVFSIRQ